MYYRKISDNEFITTTENYYQNIENEYLNLSNSKNYIIYALNSGSVFQPYKSNSANPNSIFLQKNYQFQFLYFVRPYLFLINFVYL